MSTSVPSTQARVALNRPPFMDQRLRGRWLAYARILWLVVAGLVCGLFLASIPTYVVYLQTPTTGVVVNLNSGQLTQEGVQALHALNLSITFYAISSIVLNAIFLLGFITVGGVLFWRKAENRVALFTSFALLTFPTGLLFQMSTLPSVWWLLEQFVGLLSGISFSLVFSLFPDGRFVPRWTRWLMIGWVFNGVDSFLPSSFQDALSIPGNLLLFALLLSLVAVQVYRYRRVSTEVERQQTKWVVFGFTMGIVGFLGVIIPGQFFFSLFQPGTLLYFVGNTAMHLFLLGIPFSLGIAILRSRLWEIDIIINRALVYGGLSGLLLLLYASLILGLESLIGRFTGQTSQPLVIVISTLVVAALFQPLRHRVQALIDRRFYRSRYDAARTLETFSATLRHEVDLEQLSKHLLAIVQETMQPAHVSLWLRRQEAATSPPVHRLVPDEPIS